MLYIVIGNALIWLLRLMDTTNTLYSLLLFDPRAFCQGQVWRLVTYVLVPGTDGVIWLAIALYFYYFIGTNLEHAWGPGKFTIYYFTGVLLTALYSLVVWWIFRISLQVSALYLNFSLIFAFATLWPDQRVLLFFVIPLKMKWLAWADLALFVWWMIEYLLAGMAAAAFVPMVAVVVYLLYCGEWLFDWLRPRQLQSRARQRVRTVKFREAARKVHREQEARGYSRRCEICGRTDTDSPGLEFRFCSRCAGYHCFCADHINNHIHFAE